MGSAFCHLFPQNPTVKIDSGNRLINQTIAPRVNWMGIIFWLCGVEGPKRLRHRLVNDSTGLPVVVWKSASAGHD